MFRKAEMVLMPNGDVLFKNVQLDESIVSDMLDKKGDNQYYLHELRELYSKVFHYLSYLPNQYDNEGELIEAINIKINEDLEDRAKDKTDRLVRTEVKSDLMGKYEELVEKQLEGLKDGETKVITISLTDKEDKPNVEIVKEPEPDIIHDKVNVQEPIEIIKEPEFIQDIDIDECSLFGEQDRIIEITGDEEKKLMEEMKDEI